MAPEDAGSRRYDNSRRQQLAAETADRIAEAGAELLRRSPVRDWHALTVRAVAERAGVNERTVYRHFGSEKGLRDAIMSNFERAAGVDLTSLSLDDLADAAARGLRFAADFPTADDDGLDPTLHETDERRRDALVRAIEQRAPDWDERQQRRAAAVVDLLWSFSAYERFRRSWRLDPDGAIDAIQWAICLVVDAVDATDPPPAPGR